MAKRALIICNFRLRQKEEFNEIVNKFQKEKYDIYDFGEVDRENFNVRVLEYKLNEINEAGEKYEEIALISNIRDALFIWYRAYNNLINYFIFFIDKSNYNILKRNENSQILSEIAEFKGIAKENLGGKIYLNINYENYDKIFEFLFKNFKFRYFDRLENLFIREAGEKNIKNINYKKKYTLENRSLVFGTAENEEEIDLEIKEENSDMFYNYIDISKYFYPFYSLFIIRNYSLDDARNILIKCYEKYGNSEEKIKEEIAELILNTDKFKGLKYNEKIGLLSINFVINLKKCKYTTTPVLDEIIEDNGKNADTYYQIFNNFNLYNIKDFEFEKRKKMINLSDEYYRKKINEKEIDRKNNLLFIVDSLETKSYSGTKLLFDIIENIIKKDSEIKIAVYSEENFFGNQEENPFMMDYNNRLNILSYEKEKMQYAESKVKIIYSDIYKKKEERVADLINFVNEFKPKAVISTTIYSAGLNVLHDILPTIHLSLGSVNYLNKFDVYLYPHFEYIKNMIPEKIMKIDLERMYSFDYTGEFLESKEAGNRAKYGFKEEDFVLITVGVRVAADINAGIAEVVTRLIKDKKNVKWLIVGDENIPAIDERYREYIGENIIKVKQIDNLSEVYPICDVYINPPRIGGGFSMAEAIVNNVCVLTPIVSPAGVLHCGIENSSKNLNEYMLELYKVYENKSYRMEKLEKEKKVQESLKIKNNIDKIFKFVDIAEKQFMKRKEK